jgi:hypothetical protein
MTDAVSVLQHSAARRGRDALLALLGDARAHLEQRLASRGVRLALAEDLVRLVATAQLGKAIARERVSAPGVGERGAKRARRNL